MKPAIVRVRSVPRPSQVKVLALELDGFMKWYVRAIRAMGKR